MRSLNQKVFTLTASVMESLNEVYENPKIRLYRNLIIPTVVYQPTYIITGSCHCQNAIKFNFIRDLIFENSYNSTIIFNQLLLF